jgi:hypothetical protein
MSFLQCSRQQGHQLGLVDALVRRVAVVIYFILLPVTDSGQLPELRGQ